MKKYLLITVAILLIVSVPLHFLVFGEIFTTVFSINNIILVLLFAIGLQLVGHIFRAARTKLLIDQAASSSLKFQTGTLAVGYLFNFLFFFRIGEIIRAILIAKRLRISFLYTFVSVLVERSIDVLFLVIVAGIFLAISGLINGILLSALILAGGISTAILISIYLLKNENKFLLKIIYTFTSLFNNSLNNSLRFKLWSLIYGLQNFFSNAELVRRYIFLAISSWAFYLVSTYVLFTFIVGSENVLSNVFATFSSYVANAPGLINISYETIVKFGEALEINGQVGGFVVGAAIWFLLTVPVSAIGLVSLVLYGTKKRQPYEAIAPNAFTNKLSRYQDISQAFPVFLETYFKGFNLSKVLHKIEVSGGLSLVKFFKGGSDAITVLALNNDTLLVKKIVPKEFESRLKVQYEWLTKFSNKKMIVNVKGEESSEDHYAIDLDYNPQYISLFEYIHTHSLDQSKQAITKVLDYMFKNIYSLKKEAFDGKNRDLYLEDRLFKKLEKAVSVDENLKAIIDDEFIVINGEKLLNLNAILDKIKNSPAAWRDLGTYRKSGAIHGDLTIDNILIHPEKHEPLLIDPSDDNQIRGPIIDFGRLTQSLVAGYEFLNANDEPTMVTMEDGLPSINYQDQRSARYMELYDYLEGELLDKYLTPTEKRTVLFHSGLLYGRMLAHRVVINPRNTLKYYAVSVTLLNKFIQQYDD
jgi:hypothetical protein